jgi:hypothetical protein
MELTAGQADPEGVIMISENGIVIFLRIELAGGH